MDKLKGFTQVPNLVLFDTSLSPLDRLVMATLLSFDWQDGNGVRKRQVWPSIETLANLVGRSRRQIIRALQRLEQAGYIAIARDPGNVNVYRILADVGGVKNDTGGYDIRDTGGMTSMTPELYKVSISTKEDEVHAHCEKVEGAHSASPNEHAANAAQTQTPTTTFENLSQTAVPATATATPESVVSGLVAALGYDRTATLLGAGYIGPTADGGVQVHVPQEVAAAWGEATHAEVAAAVEQAGAVLMIDGVGPGMVHPRTREADIPTPRAG